MYSKDQHALVEKSVEGFINNLILSVSVVTLTLCLFMGWRSGMVVGSVLLVTVMGTVLIMWLMGLQLQRISLGAMVIAMGMLVDNAIVLIEEIDLQIEEGKTKHLAIVDASVSRLRPVALAAVTTILGMAPLLFDPFFADMSVTIMGGLAFATILTLIAVPLLYSILFRVSYREQESRA